MPPDLKVSLGPPFLPYEDGLCNQLSFIRDAGGDEMGREAGELCGFHPGQSGAQTVSDSSWSIHVLQQARGPGQLPAWW